MKRPWTYYRHHRDRMIRRRVDIVRNVWGDSALRTADPDKIAGYHFGELSKRNLACSCPMCRGPRYDRHSAQREALRELQEAA